jgi:tripartite-type tricarboxylate transporter receptor subunit TctC
VQHAGRSIPWEDVDVQRAKPVLSFAAFAVCALALTVSADAQPNYPNTNVRVVVPYAAGGAVDPMARLLADRLSKSLKQNFVVENRPGAGGNIGIESVTRQSKHDGYTLLVTPSAVAINPSLYAHVPYDIDKDLIPIGMINRTPMVMLTTPSLGVKTVADFVARVKQQPGKINYAISGNGTLDHLVCEHFRTSAKLDMVKVNYGGVPKGMTALLTGEVQMMVVAANAALPYVKSGKVIPLAVTSAERSPELPDVPTLTEAGLKDFVLYGWSMMFAPAGTPQAAVETLHDAVEKAVTAPDFQKFIATLGSDSQSMSLPQLKTYVHDQATMFSGLVKASGAHVD